MKKATKSKLIVETERVGYDGRYYLIVPDHASGKQNVYTVYQVPSSPSRRIRVVGQELPLQIARDLVSPASTESGRK